MTRTKWAVLYGVGLAGTAASSAGLGLLAVDGRWAFLAAAAAAWVLSVALSTVALINAKEARP